MINFTNWEPEWILCSERMPELTNHHDGGGMITGRNYSDDVLVLLPEGTWADEGHIGPPIAVMQVAMKPEDDYGIAPANTYFWMRDGDLWSIVADGYNRFNDSPIMWAELPKEQP